MNASRIKRAAEWSRKPATKAAALVSLLVVVVAITIQLAEGTPDTTTVALIVLAVMLIFGLLAPRQTEYAIQRVTNFKFAGVLEVGLAAVARAESVKPPPGDEDDGIVEKRDGQGYEQLVDLLEEKMRFVYDITHMSVKVDDKHLYHEIAYNLASDHLLDHEETQFVLDLISGRDIKLSALPSEARDEFLDAAWTFAARFGYVVWDRFIRSELCKRGWATSDFRQLPGHRRDFLAWHGGHWVLLAARVGELHPHYYGPTRQRLEETTFEFPIDGRCIVIPGKIDRKATVVKDQEELESPVKVLELQGSLLEHPERALESDPCNQDPLRPSGDC